jgi:hypothetical protein
MLDSTFIDTLVLHRTNVLAAPEFLGQGVALFDWLVHMFSHSSHDYSTFESVCQAFFGNEISDLEPKNARDQHESVHCIHAAALFLWACS